jgi:hypothetical protein
MPHDVGLVQMLFRAPERVNAAGQIHLSAAEAEYVRAMDFPTATEGFWPLPEWPAYVLEVYPDLARLTEDAKQLEEREERRNRALPPPPTSTTPVPRFPSVPLAVVLVRRAQAAPLDRGGFAARCSARARPGFASADCSSASTGCPPSDSMPPSRTW